MMKRFDDQSIRSNHYNESVNFKQYKVRKWCSRTSNQRGEQRVKWEEQRVNGRGRQRRSEWATNAGRLRRGSLHAGMGAARCSNEGAPRAMNLPVQS